MSSTGVRREANTDERLTKAHKELEKIFIESLKPQGGDSLGGAIIGGGDGGGGGGEPPVPIASLNSWKLKVRIVTDGFTATFPEIIVSAAVWGLASDLAQGDRVLLKDELVGANNGIWEVGEIGAVGQRFLFRPLDFNSNINAFSHSFVAVDDGVHKDEAWFLQTIEPIFLGVTNQVWKLFMSAGAGADPTINKEIDLGDLSGGFNIDLSKANKFFGRLIGNATCSFINTPPTIGFYQNVLLEIRQNATGQFNLTFADPFENDHVPIVKKQALAYTVWSFYMSNRTGAEPIFGFNTQQSVAPQYAMSDELTPLNTPSTSVPFTVFRIGFPMIVREVRANVRTIPTGSGLTLDIKKGGVSILSTLLTIDVNEESSLTAAIPAVIATEILEDDAEMELFLTNRDALNTATGLKVTLVGYIE